MKGNHDFDFGMFPFEYGLGVFTNGGNAGCF